MSPPFLYDSIVYAALGTPRLEQSIGFYRDLMGLELTEHQPGEYAAFRCSTYATNLLLQQHEEAGLLRIGLKLQSGKDLRQAEQHFQKRGYDVEPLARAASKQLGIGSGFSVREPNSGITFDYFDTMLVPAYDFQPSLTKIQRLGHVVIKLQDFEPAWRALEADFGFVTSDYVEDKAVWMRCYPNPFHHSLAIIKDENEGLHHVNFMVSEIDDVGAARNRLMDAGVDIVFGPGRHKPSNSIFLYFTDPAGMTMEFSFGMEEFPQQEARQPRKLANTARVMDLWGGLPKPGFARKGRIIKS